MITTEAETFERLTSICFDNIRQYGQSSVDVTIRLLDGLSTVAAWTRRLSDLAVVERHAIMLQRGAQTAVPEPWDQERIKERFDRVMTIVQSVSTGSTLVGSATGNA